MEMIKITQGSATTFPAKTCLKLSKPELQILYTWMVHYATIWDTVEPSIDYLSDVTRMSRRRVIKYLSLLEQAGLIQKQKRFNNSTIYDVYIAE